MRYSQNCLMKASRLLGFAFVWSFTTSTFDIALVFAKEKFIKKLKHKINKIFNFDILIPYA